MTGTVESTCTPTPAASQSSRRRSASQQLLSISRKKVPSASSIRARHSPAWSSRMGAHCGSSGGSRWVWTSRLRMRAPAPLAGGVGRVAPVPLEDGRQLLHDVGEVERLAVELVAARVADPEKGVLFIGQAAPLDDQPHAVRGPLRRVRGARREEEDLALADGHVHGLLVLEQAQVDVALHLVEELLALV